MTVQFDPPRPQIPRPEVVRAISATATIGDTTYADEDTNAAVSGPISVDLTRELGTDLPEAVAGGGWLVKTTGRIELNDPTPDHPGVLTDRISPWTPSTAGWPPARALPVTIDATVSDDWGSDDTTRRFTGLVAATSGASDETTTVQVEDHADDFKINISHAPMQRTMPPTNDDGPYRNIGLSADYLVNYIFRKAGWYTTPRVMGVGLLSVPAQHSMWPEIGGIGVSAATSSGGMPAWYPAPWGWAVADVTARYSPGGYGNQTLRGRSISLAMCCDSVNHTGAARMDVTLGSAILSFRVIGNRVELRLNGNVIASPALGQAPFTKIESVWSANGSIRLRTDGGYDNTFTWSPTDAVLDGPYSSTELIIQPAARVGGFIVQMVPNSYSGGYIGVNASATIVAGTLLTNMRAMPAIVSRDGLDLLKEISEATVCSSWIDNDGHLWWVHPDIMHDQAPAATLTADADLLALSWEDNGDNARRSVTVQYDDPTVKRKKRARITAWEGGGDSLDQGESVEEIVSPESGVDWIMLAGFSPAIYATPAPSNPQAIPDFNRGFGSFPGGTHLNADGDTPAKLLKDGKATEANAHEFPDLQRNLEQIGPQAWKLTLGLEDIADNYWRSLQFSLDLDDALGSRINNNWNGQKMPILRCKATTTWTEQSYTSSITGPARYEVLTHEAGPWLGTAVEAIGDWIARQVTVPGAYIKEMPVAYRGDLRLGQVVDIVEDSIYHIQLRVLIVGLSESLSEADAELRLTGRVISLAPTRWTYDDLARLGLTYDQLEELYAGKTYIDLMVPPEGQTLSGLQQRLRAAYLALGEEGPSVEPVGHVHDRVPADMDDTDDPGGEPDEMTDPADEPPEAIDPDPTPMPDEELA